MPSKHKAGGCGCCTCDCNDVRLFYGFTNIELSGLAGPVTVFEYGNEIAPTTWPGFSDEAYILPTSPHCFYGGTKYSGVQSPLITTIDPWLYPCGIYRAGSSTGYPFYLEGCGVITAVRVIFGITYNCYFFPDTYTLTISSLYHIWSGYHPVGAWFPSFTVSESTSGGVRYKKQILQLNYNYWLVTQEATAEYTTSITSVNLAGGGSHPYDVLGAFVGTVTVS